MNTISHRCPRYSVRSVHSRPLLEKFLDILAARQHLAVAYSKDRSRYRAQLIPKSRCRSQNGSLRCLSLEELQDRAAAHARLLVSQCALDTSFVRRMHAHVGYACVGYACVAEPEQRSALNRCTCQKFASRVGSATVARRGAPAAAAPSARSASNVHKLADAKYARLKRPVLEDAPPPVAVRQLLPRRGLLGDQVRVARERRYTHLRRRCSGAAQRRRTMPRRRRV